MVKIRGINETVLIERISYGDKTAFEIIFHHYYPGLVLFANQFVFDKAEAEDIVQDFFVKFWQIKDQIEHTDTLKSYFFSSIRNSCINNLKHKKIKNNYLNWLSESSSHSLLYNEDLYVVSELQEKLKRSLDLLPTKCREVFIMSRLKGMKNDEIADQLNISKRTVETHISNAIKVLRMQFKDYFVIILFIPASVILNLINR